MRRGERQVAPTRAGIRRDHVARYEWAARELAGAARVADLACGIGYGTQLLAEAGCSVVGFDRSQEALAYGKKHYAHARANYRRLDACKPAGIGSFDLAVCFETIEHLKDPLPLLKALRQAAPKLLASVPNEIAFPWNRHRFHYRHYTLRQFEALLIEAGWEVMQWLGQAGPESDVAPGATGRTLIAVAQRAPAAAVPASPAHVAILGMGPSVAQYLEITKRAGGRKKFCDETWGINAMGDVYACDRIFHMDDVRIQEVRAAARPDSNIAAMLEWMRQHPGPIYTSRLHPDYPGLVEFPLEEVINDLGYTYFNSTAAYAVAFAVAANVKKISLFGIDYTYANAHHAEKGRACLEFYLGIAAARGIKISIPRISSLMDACYPASEHTYGYDTREVKLERQGERMKVSFLPKAGPLPTADEIEAKYDHSQHPSPFVKTVEVTGD